MRARVVEVLARAESLFTTPAEAATTAQLDAAAEASRGLAARSAELSGAAITAHRDLATSATQRLEHAADTDAHLAEQVARAGQTHAEARSQASALRAEAAEVGPRLDAWAGLPASEITGLKALRDRVARMQQLLAQHRQEAVRTASQIRSLGYGQ
ncbi:hypothetical protein [Mycobacterium branderi]|uniref:hypothetical protein n=1 Tax=Mycobacterium branderi TaxID=43348 RepID=UPI00111C384A|nr:hypothetical protein [Mycobacterium branderi]MCV7236187.1 hypothetical protein [Mycobacterium branderi]